MDRGLVEFVVIDQLVPKEHLLRKIDAAVDFNRLYENSNICSDLSVYRHPALFRCKYYTLLTSPCCVLQTCNIFFHFKRPPGILFVQLADRTFYIRRSFYSIISARVIEVRIPL